MKQTPEESVKEKTTAEVELLKYNHGGGGVGGKLVADNRQDWIVEFSTFRGRWACSGRVIIHLLDQVEDVQPQVGFKVESQASGERGDSARRKE